MNPMNPALQNSITNGLTYSEYKTLVTELFKKGTVTGREQTEHLLHYTELNEARVRRLDKTLVVIDEVKQFLEGLKKEYIWLVISEGWCGDSAQIVPIINKMAEASDKIDLRIVLRDDNDDLMNLFLTNGTRSIPLLIIIDKEILEVIAQFGPRPQDAKQLILDYKATYGVVDETAKTNLHKWYSDDKGISTQKEIMALMQ
jgi:hypothetical protein